MGAGEVVVVANPTAGHGKAGRLIGKLDRLLHEAGVDHLIRVSESGPGLERLAREAAEDGAEVVAALGGDGSMGLAANGLLGTPAALAAVPSGTADDFATSLGVRSVEGAVRAIAERHVVPIDVVKITTGTERRHYVNVAGCGFDSEVKVQLDDEMIEGPHMLVVVGNAISYGGGMKVTPDASVVDGLLDVCLLEAVSVPTFLRAFPKVFRGTHVRHPNVRMLRSRRVAIEADRRVMVYADGERVGPAPAIFEVVPEALPVVVGPNAKAVR
jgi:diacylglycerol kinase (ATP)